jgi:hypothetical protein
MKFCYHCGSQLSLGNEKYCPECGEGLTPAPAIDGSGSTGTGTSGAMPHIPETSGDAGSVINLQVNSISAAILQELKDVLSRPVQLETKSDLGQQPHNINTELNAQARVTNCYHLSIHSYRLILFVVSYCILH